MYETETCVLIMNVYDNELLLYACISDLSEIKFLFNDNLMYISFHILLCMSRLIIYRLTQFSGPVLMFDSYNLYCRPRSYKVMLSSLKILFMVSFHKFSFHITLYLVAAFFKWILFAMFFIFVNFFMLAPLGI